MLLLDLLNPLWPTHFVGYLDNLMAVCGFRSVLKTPYSGKYNSRLKMYLHLRLAVSVFKLDD
jgi:hypothetical protein